MTRGILDAMNWLGLHWDEGPYMQSAGFDQHRRSVEILLGSGHAYYCFCSPESLDQKRKEAAARKAEYTDDRTCLNISAAEVKPRLDNGGCAAVRVRVPDGPVSVNDAVVGDVTIASEMIEDFVLLRSNGQPTYHVSVVVDDIDMRVTHVIRGADHISNTPKQVLLYGALGTKPPVFAHVPLILGADKSRLSKRHGATDVNMYRTEGFLPEAFRNFLALLGWAPGGSEEFMRTSELLERFSLEGVSRTNGVFDRPKLEWFNTQYLQRLPIEELLPQVEAELKRSGLWKDEWASGPGREWFSKTVDLLRPRVRLLPDFASWSRAFFSDDFPRDPAAKEKFWKEPAKIKELLSKTADALSTVSDWSHDPCDHATRAVAEAAGVKAGLLINAIRVAIVGQAVAPPLFDTMVVLGEERVVRRLREGAAELS